MDCDLKTCPFCGAPALLDEDDGSNGHTNFPFAIYCGGDSCPAYSLAVISKAKDDCIARWNRRSA